MSEMKLTEQELTELRDFQKKLNEVLIQLGQLELQQLNIDYNKAELKERYNGLMNIQTSLSKSLSEKYGDGIVDPMTGVFKPTPR